MFETRESRARHGAVNIGLGLLNALIVSIVFAGATLIVTERAQDAGFGVLNWVDGGFWVEVVAAVLLFDLWQYLWHRLNHKVPFLWRFHAVHHSDREMDASSGFRFHTGEIVLSSAVRLAVLPLLGLSIQQLLVYETILLPIILFHHSNVRISGPADRMLRWLIVTPWMHWVHHSDQQPETDSNYSSIFSIWDRVFRSFKLRNNPQTITLGLDYVEQRATWATLPGMLTMPFRKQGGLADSQAEADVDDPGQERLQ